MSDVSALPRHNLKASQKDISTLLKRGLIFLVATDLVHSKHLLRNTPAFLFDGKPVRSRPSQADGYQLGFIRRGQTASTTSEATSVRPSVLKGAIATKLIVPVTEAG